MKLARSKESALRNQEFWRQNLEAEHASRLDNRPMQYAESSAFNTKRSFNVKSMSRSPAPKVRTTNSGDTSMMSI